jgi:hypothetical protein
LHFTHPSFFRGDSLFLERQERSPEDSLEDLDLSLDDPDTGDKMSLLVLVVSISTPNSFEEGWR